jgi:outer membrane protein TolC
MSRSRYFLALPLVILTALPTAFAADAAPSAEKPLGFEEALTLGLKNNRDLQAARVRLRGAYTDVEKAIANLMPTLNFTGKMTVNHPEVALDLSGQAFSGAYQGAQVLDLQVATGSPMRGPIANGLLDIYCRDPNKVTPAGVKEACEGLLNPKPDALEKAFSQVATIVPRVQVDGIIALNMPLIVPAAYPGYKGVKLNFKSQEKQLEVTTIQVLITIASSFYSAAGNDELVGARRHAIEVAQKTLDNAKVRLAAGVVNKVEVTRAQLALIQAEQRLLEALDSRAAAYRALATAIVVDAGSFKVQPPPEPNIELASEETMVRQAIDRRPELASLDLQRQALGQQVFSQWLRWSPSLTLFGNIRLTNATGFAGRVDSYVAGLQLDWMIFDGFARDAQRHLFEAQKRDSQLKLEQQRAQISDDVVNGRRSVMTTKQGLFTAQRSMQMAQETLELVRTQYQAGTATQLDLLNAQDALIQSEVGVAQARFNLSLAMLNIRRLIGDTFVDVK